jgi:hypothetical protein
VSDVSVVEERVVGWVDQGMGLKERREGVVLVGGDTYAYLMAEMLSIAFQVALLCVLLVCHEWRCLLALFYSACLLLYE